MHGFFCIHQITPVRQANWEYLVIQPLWISGEFLLGVRIRRIEPLSNTTERKRIVLIKSEFLKKSLRIPINVYANLFDFDHNWWKANYKNDYSGHPLIPHSYYLISQCNVALHPKKNSLEAQSRGLADSSPFPDSSKPLKMFQVACT